MFSLSRNVFLRRCVTALAAFALTTPVWADSSKPAKKADLSRIVVVGDSLAAGFQSFSLYDFTTAPAGTLPGGQTTGFAALVGERSGHPLTLPRISYPGIPPVLLFDPTVGVYRAQGTGSRVNVTEQATNLAVPGFTLADAISRTVPRPDATHPPTNPIDALALSVLASPGTTLGCAPIPVGTSLVLSEVGCAVALKPTTVIVDIGNNDALQQLTFGTAPTDPNTFRTQYRALLTALSFTKASIVVGNIPDVTAIPFLIPPGVCPATGADYGVPDITNPTVTTFTPCYPIQTRTAAQVAAAQNAVTAYNQIIAQEAARVGAVVVDVNALMKDVVANGRDVVLTNPALNINGVPVHLSGGPGGGIYSLDSMHPGTTGYAMLANAFINAMNAKPLNAAIPLVDVNAVASLDPMVLALLPH